MVVKPTGKYITLCIYAGVLSHALPVGFNFWACGCSQLRMWPFNWLFFTFVGNVARFLDFLATFGNVDCMGFHFNAQRFELGTFLCIGVNRKS